MQDYSFIRLKPSFLEAKTVDPKISRFNYHNVIQLLPNKTYLQVTNVSGGIAFDGDLQVLVVNCNDETLADVTANVYVSEFTSNGIGQCRIEYKELNVNFYNEPVYFKFIKTTGSDVWWSNPLLITDENQDETTRFDYKSYKQFHGIDYPVADVMQSIQLRTWYDRPADETEVKDYYQISNGNTISTRALLKETEIYKFDYVNPFVFRAANVMLIHDVIYIDGVRMTNKTTLQSSDRLGQSNLMETEFIVNKNYNDIYSFAYQIFEPLELVSKSPYGIYNDVGDIPALITAQFNKDIIKTTGTVNIYRADNSLLVSNDENFISVLGDSFTVDITGMITIDGVYHINISNGLVESGSETFTGISNATDWTFELLTPAFVITSITGASPEFEVNFTINITPDTVFARYRQTGDLTWIDVAGLFTDVSPAVFDIPLTGDVDVQLFTDAGLYSNIYIITI